MAFRIGKYVCGILLVMVLAVFLMDLFIIPHIGFSWEYVRTFVKYHDKYDQAVNLLLNDYVHITAKKDTVYYVIEYQEKGVSGIRRHERYSDIPIVDETVIIECLNGISELFFNSNKISVIYVEADRVTFCAGEASEVVIYKSDYSIPCYYTTKTGRQNQFVLYPLAVHWYYGKPY